MSKPWKLKRTVQCKHCPWLKSTVPARDTPNEYSEDKHEGLRKTIADPNDPMSTMGKELHVMACHETHSTHCIGWLDNQRGEGNNIGLRIALGGCTNAHKVRLRGPNHATFDETLPKASKC